MNLWSRLNPVPPPTPAQEAALALSRRRAESTSPEERAALTEQITALQQADRREALAIKRVFSHHRLVGQEDED